MRSWFLCAALPLVLSACAQGIIGSVIGGPPTLENGTGRTIMYYALKLDDSYGIDPAPELRVADQPERLVPPGERREIDIHGYSRGDDVRLFLYLVDAAAQKAALREVLTVTNGQLRRRAYRVVVEKL